MARPRTAARRAPDARCSRPRAPAGRSPPPAGTRAQDANDILYEEDLLRNSYSLKYWLRYLDAKRRSAPASRNVVYERALKHLPGSYKLWRMYLRDRREQVKAKCRAGRAHDELVNVHERALVYMHKMPRIWLDYLELLCELPRPTHTRHAFDRALRALPLTQHERVWPLYLTFVSRLGVTETAVRVYRRYLKVRAPPAPAARPRAARARAPNLARR